MNIFCTSKNPYVSAKMLDNKRVIKMILESAQMLSTAINCYGGKAPYKSAFVNHPCSKWVRRNKSNYKWLLAHFKALNKEYTRRYHKIHKCYSFYFLFSEGADLLPKGKLTTFVNCTIYKEEKNVFKAYRKYLLHKWQNDKRKPIWRVK